MAFESSTTNGATLRAPIWPLFIAPIVTVVYYVAVRAAFAESITSIVKDATDINLKDVSAPHWGSHWFYRTFAEAVSIAFGTFITAGLARGRAKLAGIIGGLAISLFFLLQLSFLFFAGMYLDPESYSVKEPFSQHVVDGLVVIAAPLIGAAVSNVAVDIHRDNLSGFGGINRLHFLWLWFPAYFYTLGLVAPVIQLGMRGDSGNRLFDAIQTIILAMPVLMLVVPLIFALGMFAGHIFTGWRVALRNIVGVVVLIVGWIVGAFLQFVWAKLIGALFG